MKGLKGLFGSRIVGGIALSEVNFGVGLPSDLLDYQYLVKFAVEAETKGLDSIWMPDHGFIPWEAFTTLSAIASKTTTIRLGTSVIDLNRRNPATLAQMVSSLDHLSQGRFIFGVGSGVVGWNPWGVDISRPVTRMRESLEVIKQFWTQNEVNYAGDFYTFKKASINLKPLQTPHPPVWVAAFGPRLLKITAELGDGLISQTISPFIFKEVLHSVKQDLSKAGRNPLQFDGVFSGPMSIAPKHVDALNTISPLARSWLSDSSGVPNLAERLGYDHGWDQPNDVPIDAIEQCFIFGTPNDWINKIEKFIKAGVNTFIAIKLDPPNLKSLDLYAT